MLEFTAHKSTASNVKLRLGLLTFSVDLVSAMPEDRSETAFKLGCPHSHGDTGPLPVKQKYLCDWTPPEGEDPHGPFSQHELTRIRQVAVKDGKVDPTGTVTDDSPWVEATVEEIVAAKVGTLAKGTVDLAVHPADQVLTACRPGDKGYLVRPTKTKGNVDATDEQMYGLLLSLVAERPDLALVGAMRLRDSRAPYRVTVFDGQLYLEQVVLPDQIRERDTIEVEVLPSQAQQLSALAEQLCTDFDPSVHAWDAAAAVKELVAAKVDGADAPATETHAPVQVLDLDAMIAGALAAAAPTGAAA